MKKPCAIATAVAVVAVIAVAFALIRLFYTPLPEDGTWVLADETTAWLGRGCALMEFPAGAVPAIETRIDGREASVTFNDESRTQFRGRVRGRSIVVGQPLPVTETGRFCGQFIQVQMHLRVSQRDPEEITGNWRLPECDVCTTRRIHAVRQDQALRR